MPEAGAIPWQSVTLGDDEISGGNDLYSAPANTSASGGLTLFDHATEHRGCPRCYRYAAAAREFSGQINLLRSIPRTGRDDG